MQPTKLKIQNHNHRMQLVGILADNGYKVSIETVEKEYSIKHESYVVIEEGSKCDE